LGVVIVPVQNGKTEMPGQCNVAMWIQQVYSLFFSYVVQVLF